MNTYRRYIIAGTPEEAKDFISRQRDTVALTGLVWVPVHTVKDITDSSPGFLVGTWRTRFGIAMILHQLISRRDTSNPALMAALAQVADDQIAQTFGGTMTSGGVPVGGIPVGQQATFSSGSAPSAKLTNYEQALAKRGSEKLKHVLMAMAADGISLTDYDDPYASGAAFGALLDAVLTDRGSEYDVS